MLPHPKHLKTFRAICHEGSMKKAGDVLHRSRSAISHAVDELEDIMDVELFERNERGMLLTDFGRILLRRADFAFDEMEVARKILGDLCTAQGTRAANAPIYSLSLSERRLKVLIAFAQHKHMGAVADLLGISQPAVSLAIRDLDLSTGLPLFERSAGAIRLTRAGEVLLLHVKRALLQLRLANAEISIIKGKVEGTVTVGSLPFGGGSILPRAVGRLLVKYPNLHVVTIEGTFDTLASALWCGDIDLMVGALQPVGKYTDLVAERLFDDRISIIARADHPLVRHGSPTLRSVLAALWVLPSAGTPTRHALTDELDRHALPHPNVVVECSDVSTIRGLLFESDLITAAARRLFHHELEQGSLVILPVEQPVAWRSIGILTRIQEHASPATQLLMEELRTIGRAHMQHSSH